MNNFEFGRITAELASDVIRDVFKPAVTQSSDLQDRVYASDLRVTFPYPGSPTLDLAIRGRRHYPARFDKNPNWAHEITIRNKAYGGGKTELDKILEGYGDYMFYCFVDEMDMKIAGHHVIDLDAFRWAHKAGMVGRVFCNDWDGTGGVAYNLVTYPQIAMQCNPPQKEQLGLQF
jgi:hypothetical protein